MASVGARNRVSRRTGRVIYGFSGTMDRLVPYAERFAA
jgi:hypothetical protein